MQYERSTLATFDLYTELDPTIIGIQEANKNWTLYDRTEGPVHDVITHQWPGTKIVTAHYPDPVFKGPHQPGRVAQITLKKITGRVLTRGKDPLGSFTWQQILLDGTRMLNVITAYRVSQDNPTSCRNKTCYMQQWRQLRFDGTELPNPRQRTLNALQEFILLLTHDNNEVIVMVDADPPVHDNAIDTFLQETNMHDLTTPFLPDDPPPTYQRGCNKIDHIWGTPGVLTAKTGAGILPFSSGPKSDHAIIYCDLSLSLLSGLSPDLIHDPTHPVSHNLWSTDIKAAEHYIEIVQHVFEMENISE
jgi:hypothetical protein